MALIISCNLIFIDLLAFPTTSQKWWLQPLRNGYTRVTILKILAEYIWVLKNVHGKFHSPIPQYNWSNGRNHGCFWEGVCNQVNQPVRTTQQNLHHSAAQAQISTRQNLIFLMQSCVLWIFSLPATKPPSFNHREPQKTEGKDKSHIREQSNKHIPENC